MSQGIGGLVPGLTYHYRAVATNFGGTTLGPDLTFTTPAPPPAETPPSTPAAQGAVQPPRQGDGGSSGNTKPKKCKKGFVKRNGKCVKKKKRKKNGGHG